MHTSNLNTTAYFVWQDPIQLSKTLTDEQVHIQFATVDRLHHTAKDHRLVTLEDMRILVLDGDAGACFTRLSETIYPDGFGDESTIDAAIHRDLF